VQPNQVKDKSSGIERTFNEGAAEERRFAILVAEALAEDLSRAGDVAGARWARQVAQVLRTGGPSELRKTFEAERRRAVAKAQGPA
jgi:hypothetical protein